MASHKSKISLNEIATKMREKLLVVFFVVVALLIALSVVMIRINLKKGEDYSKAVYENFSYTSKTISAKRGDITDCNGTILAYSIKVYNLILDSKVLLSKEEYREPTVTALLKYFPDLDADTLNNFLDENEKATTKSSYKRLLLALSSDDIADFQTAMEENAEIAGVWFEEEYQRVYPYDSLAADMIGFASEQNGGEIGMESYYDEYLAGTDGRTYGYINDDTYVSETINATNGCTVVSTIDYTVQNIVEESIRSFNEEYGSASSSVIVMDPNNGEILAMADYPTFDLNNPRDLSSIYTEEELAALSDSEKVEAYYSLWSNSTISWVYEPGSVFKSLVLGACLEEGAVSLDDIWVCDGYAIYNGALIHCNNVEGHGNVTTTGAILNSCNDALMQMGALLGPTRFCNYLRTYQFGRKTGIDLPGEEQGLLIDEENMMDVDLATNCFGQNLNVTMVQMASAISSLINGGTYYQPHVVKRIVNASGDTVKEFEPVVVGKTISEETSEILRTCYRATVDYGPYYKFPGYSIGGKSGTAQKAGRTDESYVVSFISFTEAEDPQFLIYVVVDAPQVEEYNTSFGAQVIYRDIMERLILYYNIPMSDAEYSYLFKFYAEDEDYITVPSYDESDRLTTPIPEDDEVIIEEDASGYTGEDLAEQYPDGVDPSNRGDTEDIGSTQNTDNGAEGTDTNAQNTANEAQGN